MRHAPLTTNMPSVIFGRAFEKSRLRHGALLHLGENQEPRVLAPGRSSWAVRATSRPPPRPRRARVVQMLARTWPDALQSRCIHMTAWKWRPLSSDLAIDLNLPRPRR